MMATDSLAHTNSRHHQHYTPLVIAPLTCGYSRVCRSEGRCEMESGLHKHHHTDKT